MVEGGDSIERRLDRTLVSWIYRIVGICGKKCIVLFSSFEKTKDKRKRGSGIEHILQNYKNNKCNITNVTKTFYVMYLYLHLSTYDCA